MTKTKSTKRALLLSALSLLMCVSMLIGSTFAWFSDSVTSSNNKIQAGTLQIDLQVLEGNTWTSIKDSNAPIFNYDNIEPGFTAVEVLKVVNEGTLALKWYAKFTSEGVLSDLAEVIDVYVKPGETAKPADLTGYTKAGTLKEFVNTIETTTYGTLEKDASATLGIAFKMQETAGNKYQGMDLGGAFDIQIVATQYTSESDAFSNQYDANANVFNVTDTASAQAALDAAEDGAVISFDANGTYGMLYFRQSETSEVVEGYDYAQSEYDEVKIRTIKNLTIKGNGAEIAGFATESGTYNNTAHSNSADYPVLDSFIVMENVKIDGFTFDGTANAFDFYGKNAIDGLTISNCEMSSNSAHYNEYVFVHQNADQGSVNNVNGETFVIKFANVTIDNCTASAVDRLVLAYTSENLTVTNNRVSGAGMHFINLQAGSVATGLTDHTGVITITDNTYTNGAGRFFRAAYLANDAHLVLERNTVNNAFYEQTITDPDDLDLVKVNVRAVSAFTLTNYDNQINNTAVGNAGATFVPTVE